MHVAMLSADWQETGTDPDTGANIITVALHYGGVEVVRWEGVDGCQFVWGDAERALEEFIAERLRKVFELADSAIYVRSADNPHTLRYSPLAATGQDDVTQS